MSPKGHQLGSFLPKVNVKVISIYTDIQTLLGISNATEKKINSHMGEVMFASL